MASAQRVDAWPLTQPLHLPAVWSWIDSRDPLVIYLSSGASPSLVCPNNEGWGWKKFRTLDHTEKPIATTGYRCWPQKTKQERDVKVSKTFFMQYMENKHNERPTIGGVFIRSRNDAQFRRGGMVNGQMTTTTPSHENAFSPLPSRRVFCRTISMKRLGRRSPTQAFR